VSRGGRARTAPLALRALPALVAALVAFAALSGAGCSRRDSAQGPPPPATNEALAPGTLAMLRSQFETHKEQWNAVMSGPDSPLPEDRVNAFGGLGFYPYAPEWRFVGDLERQRPPRVVSLDDSKGRTQLYFEYGTYRFVAGADTAALLVYRPPDHPTQFFILFRDSTSGSETYGGGRYVHLDSLEQHKFVLDFNKAYNPYCAYDSSWVCPLPPASNTLRFAVRAGMLATGTHAE
jgi:uncharacterized protein (DUF1684 family)